MLKMKKTSGFTAVEGLLILVIVGIVGGTGWFVYNAHKKANQTLDQANQVANSTAKATNDNNVATHTSDPYAGWKEYCSPLEKGCFKYPPTWSKKIGYSDSTGDQVVITSPNGTVVHWWSNISGIGGGCDISVDPHIFVSAFRELPNLKGAYEVQTGEENSVTEIGVANTIVGNTPKVGDTDSCLVYTTFKSKDGKRDMWLQSQSLKQQDKDTVINILLSYHY